MNLRPKAVLTEEEVQKGLKLVIGDGLATEAMTALTGGTFLVAMALLMGASNFQIGLLAALPTFTNIFQLLSIWLVRRYNNRRAVSVICSYLARIPLLVVGALALLFPRQELVTLVIGMLFFLYFFGSIAGPAWNAWMKDLVPERMLGAYFSKRSRYSQLLSVILTLTLAVLLDFVKDHYPERQLETYGYMFLAGGIIGITGAAILSRAPEPQSYLSKENIFRLFLRPLRDGNFRRLLMFNSAWVFAINIATPFFSVFMMKTLGLSLSIIIGLNILSLLCNIFTVQIWGAFADRYSNKTIIAIAAPLYVLCILAWCFVGIYTSFYANMALLVAIHIVSGFALSGINLSLTNIGLKLAPNDAAIVYLSAKNIITAFFSSIAPLIGGMLADYFTSRHLNITAEWGSPQLTKVFRLLSLHEWNFLFLIGAFIAIIAVQWLSRVKEVGEVEKDVVVRVMRSSIRHSLKESFVIGHLINFHEQLMGIVRKKPVVEQKAPEKQD
jgi:MFS family permease